MPSRIMKNIIKGLSWNFSNPSIMGIINITPDSFYDGNKNSTFRTQDYLALAENHIKNGANILDLGAQSSRPGAQKISPQEEWLRLSPVLKKIRQEFPDITLSVDTFYSEVAKNAYHEGINWVNDISGGRMDTHMFDTLSELKIPYILMHSKGSPENMVNLCEYTNVLEEMTIYFSHHLGLLHKMGLAEVVLDPGLGFAKNMQQNYEIIQFLSFWKKLFQKPILIGLSRKSMVYKLLETSPEQALEGSLALSLIALIQQADILRVHDVKQTKDILRIYGMLNNAKTKAFP